MKRYQNILKFFKNNYLEYLLDNNITMVSIKIGKSLTFLVYKDELFIFEGYRSLNQAYKFYNVEKELCLEGIEYFKITKNYLSYMKSDDINVKNGVAFTSNRKKHLINYFTKGYQQEKKLSLAKVDKRMAYIIEFCENIIANNLSTESSDERVAVVKIKNKVDYIIDLYLIDEVMPNELTNRYSVNKDLRSITEDKEAVLMDARIGIFFTDGYRDCLTLEENRCGGVIYYSLGNDNLMIYKFKTISLKDIYLVLQELFYEFIPLTLTTDNEFLFDILEKTFDGKIDFILDKNNMYNRFIKELGVTLVLNNYTDYKIDAFCIIIENNFNTLVEEIENMSLLDFEMILQECCDSYKLSNLTDEFMEFEEEEEIVEEHLVDTTLLS